MTQICYRITVAPPLTLREHKQRSGAVAQWRSGAVAQWRSGAVAQWRSGAVAQWRSGAVAQWRSGAVAQWRSGAVAQWRSGKSNGFSAKRTRVRILYCHVKLWTSVFTLLISLCLFVYE